MADGSCGYPTVAASSSLLFQGRELFREAFVTANGELLTERVHR